MGDEETKSPQMATYARDVELRATVEMGLTSRANRNDLGSPPNASFLLLQRNRRNPPAQLFLHPVYSSNPLSSKKMKNNNHTKVK
jgi:hypothetical protein